MAMTAEEALTAYLTPPRLPEPTRDAELAERAERSRLNVGGDTIETYVWGEGRPVLLVHGWGGRGTQFSAFIPPLADAGYRCVAFDGPGHGRSGGTLSSGPQIGACAQAIGEREGTFAGVIAHSVGAAAVVLALERGMKAERIVTLGALCRILPRLEEFARQSGLNAATWTELLHLFQQRFSPVETSVDTIAARMTASVLLLHDPDDREVPFADSEAIADAWPNAQLLTTPGVGHRRILRSAKIVRLAADFLTAESHSQ